MKNNHLRWIAAGLLPTLLLAATAFVFGRIILSWTPCEPIQLLEGLME